ncbi:MAG TPA: hypothetical protein VLF17_02305 [Candidatus Nitrosotenuis sp.]|nr:hypothetical protein [Candidatus Nitrosotenuis sp.]
MNPAWIITGMILFGGMAAAGVSLYLKRRKESQVFDPFEDARIEPSLAEPEKDKNQAQS